MTVIFSGTAVRAGLVLLALPQLLIGAWATFAPSGWFDNFPGAGRNWLPLYGPFDGHLVADVGSTFLALGVLLALAALWMDRRLVIAAAVAYLVYQLPHTIYHLGHDDVLSSGDQIANGITLVLANLLAVGILVAAKENRTADEGLTPSPETKAATPTPQGGQT